MTSKNKIISMNNWFFSPEILFPDFKTKQKTWLFTVNNVPLYNNVPLNNYLCTWDKLLSTLCMTCLHLCFIRPYHGMSIHNLSTRRGTLHQNRFRMQEQYRWKNRTLRNGISIENNISFYAKSLVNIFHLIWLRIGLTNKKS